MFRFILCELLMSPEDLTAKSPLTPSAAGGLGLRHAGYIVGTAAAAGIQMEAEFGDILLQKGKIK